MRMIAGIAQCGSPSQSIGVDADDAERVVEEAVARVIEVPPDDRDRDERRDERREVDRAEEALKRTSFAVDEQRGAERHGDRERPADEREIERVAERLPEQRRRASSRA